MDDKEKEDLVVKIESSTRILHDMAIEGESTRKTIQMLLDLNRNSSIKYEDIIRNQLEFLEIRTGIINRGIKNLKSLLSAHVENVC